VSASATSRAGRRRLVAVLAGAGLVVAAGPALAAPREDPEEAAALVLLTEAAQASRTLSYSGTQYVATWGPAATTTTLVEVQHAPGRGARVRTTAETDAREPVVLASGVLDEQLLDVLRDRYVLRLAGQGHCAGRAAHVVEAHRPGAAGSESTVAGRFWIDHETGLLLRREVFDRQGRRLRSSAFLDLDVRPASSAVLPVLLRSAAGQHDAGEPVAPARLRRLRAEGYAVPERLPGGFVLFDARSRVHDGSRSGADGGGEVLHLAYSDGLSTTSLFSQPGELGGTPPAGFRPRAVAGEQVWASGDAPQRMVWPGGGRVWTLVSDAPDDAVTEAVGALPHEALPDAGAGWRARLSRGAARLAAVVNPFS
jgi:sigma-E factor negative regulatory protein RseB